MKDGDKVEIVSGRLKGEIGTVVGETNLNMNHLWIVRRHKKGVRNKQMGFSTTEFRKEKDMKKAEWRKAVMVGCKQKRKNTDSSAFCIYCRKKGGSCAFENCPSKP